jgi:hypothetical protein
MAMVAGLVEKGKVLLKRAMALLRKRAVPVATAMDVLGWPQTLFRIRSPLFERAEVLLGRRKLLSKRAMALSLNQFMA